jgi:hypothetical protein
VYLVNFLSLQTASQLFLSRAQFRLGQDLVGSRNGSNLVFTVPDGDKFTHNLPFLTIQVYFNGQRLKLIDDFVINESDGPGSGYDTVILEIAPRTADKLSVDYVSLDAPD